MSDDNRQDLAVSWDSCTVAFHIQSRLLGTPMKALDRLCQRLVWPPNWSYRSVGTLSYHGTTEEAVSFRFSVSGPPRAADGAYVRAKLNMIPENFNEHTEAPNG